MVTFMTTDRGEIVFRRRDATSKVINASMMYHLTAADRHVKE